MKPQWYQQAVIYEIDVSVFQDSNGDGCGDLRGLTSRLDYLAELGVTCLWLQPIFKSPYLDNGYDVTDFYMIDERWGSMEDFQAFVDAAKARGMRILLDLPVNHTSDQHPWFQSARSGRHAHHRDWYVWRTDPPEQPKSSVFSVNAWTFDEPSSAYYLHSFYPFEPDLNISNAEVREEIKRIMTHWLKTGIDGFRMDAVPFLLHNEGVKDPYGVARELYDCACAVNPEAALLGEVDLSLVELRQYFGLGAKANQVNMLLNFFLSNYLFLAFARKSAQPLTWALSMLPHPPAGGQWANFLRNHDELSLNQLTFKEKQEVLRAYAPKDSMQAFGRGPRRRLAPMLGGDARRLKLAHSLLLTLPGTPILYYGDEIGMGENLNLAERNSVRTPMQWSTEYAAGFSSAPQDQLFRPVVTGSEYGYEHVNVQAQSQNPDSLLHFMREALRVRRDLPELTLGRWRVVDANHESVLAHDLVLREREVLFVHNLSDQPATARFETDGELQEVLSDQQYETCDAGGLQLAPYGFRWFRLNSSGS